MKLLLVDFANTLMRSLAVNQQLSHNGVITGGFFGVVTQLAAKILAYEPTNIIFCRDKKPYLRANQYTEYKQDRIASERPEWWGALPANNEMLLGLLRLANIPVWTSVGWEADDLIALLVQQYKDDCDKIYILSNDDDLYQLLVFDNVTLLKNKETVNAEIFKKKYPCMDPSDWILYTAMTGTHNNISGITRCGPKTALKTILQLKKKITPELIANNKELLNRNTKLIKLPYTDGVTQLTPPKELITVSKFPRDTVRYLYQYGITMSQRMDEAFSRFNGFAKV